ncbi:MAG: hypothetical protein ACREEA_05730, partial [Stellaceae bacterium]
VWSADGAQVIFASGSSRTQLDLYRRPANGAGNEELVYAGGGAKFPKSWSRDGKFVLYSSVSEGQGIYVLALDAPLSVRKPRLFVAGGDYGQFSPDGRWVAYQSAESGRTEVYLTSFPNPGGKFLVSTSGGALPRWRADGKELFYVAPDLRLMAAEINLQATAAAIGGVRPLFGPVIFASDYSYDVTPDGQRFLVEVGNADSVPSTLTWMLNWPAALKK